MRRVWVLPLLLASGCALFTPFPELAPDEGDPLALSDDDPKPDASRPVTTGAEGGAVVGPKDEDASSTCDGGRCEASAPGSDAGPDAGPDATPEAGADATPEAGTDAGPEAGADAGTPFRWAANITSTSTFEFGPAIAMRSTGDSVVAFSGYGTWRVGSTPYPDTGAGDIGLASLDAAGSVTSVKRIDLGGVDQVRGAAFDAAGDLWLAGYTDAPSGNDRPVVRKVNASGTTILAALIDTANTTSHLRCSNIQVGDGGEIAVACNGRGTVQYTKVDGTIATVALSGTSDGVVARINPANGRVVWIVRVGAEDYDLVNAIAVDPVGAVYMTGSFESAALSVPALTRVGTRWNTFVAKLNAADGSVAWAQRWGDSVDPPVLGAGETVDSGSAGLGSAGHAIAVDRLGHVAVGGRYRGTTDLAGDQRNGDLPGFFVLLLDTTSGARVWSKYGRGTTGRGGTATDLTFDAAGNLGVSGSAYGGGTGNIGGRTFPTYGNSSAFGAKMRVSDGDVTWVTSVRASTPAYIEGGYVRFLPDGALVFGVQGTGASPFTIDLGDGKPVTAMGLIGAVARGP